MQNTIIIKTFELTDPHDIEKNGGKRMLDIAITYSLGGFSGLDWTKKPRGYKLDITPYNLNIINYNGKSYTTRETSYGGNKSGAYIFLEETKRKSKKRMEQLVTLFESNIDELKNYWLDDRNDELIRTAKQVVI